MNAKGLFITYPGCDLDLKLVLDLLKIKLSNQIIVDYLIVKENSSNKIFHIHVFIKLLKPLNTYNNEFLNLKVNNTVYHGNYQSAKNPNHIIQYLLKTFSSPDDKNILFSKSIKNRISLLGS